jgi:hypothetical protein
MVVVFTGGTKAKAPDAQAQGGSNGSGFTGRTRNYIPKEKGIVSLWFLKERQTELKKRA